VAKKYTGKAMDRRYRGQALDVTFSPPRCIHAAYCVRHLAQVFDRDRLPWVEPDGASADEVARVVSLCPSGALHYERKDGVAERAQAQNTIRLWRDGPLQVRGDLDIQADTVDIRGETRVTLCRCGQSAHKPFCDNAHVKTGFRAADAAPGAFPVDEPMPTGGKLSILPETDGPIQLQGNVTIVNADGKTIFAGDEVQLCRCGHSSQKPFCDGTHETIGFRST
jgi:CDGSH-type Zn-finger protein/uncharacterized Fe-S cluster protein YjdI